MKKFFQRIFPFIDCYMTASFEIELPSGYDIEKGSIIFDRDTNQIIAFFILKKN